MKNFLNFRLLNESFSAISKDQFLTLIKNPGNTLIHFSNSEKFPFETNQRGFVSAFNADVVGSKLGISVLKPKDAIFFWFLNKVKFLNQAGPLWQKRSYAYLADCPEGTKTFRVSRYTEAEFEKDIQTLKSKGYDFLTSKLQLDLKTDILQQLEFGSLDISLPKNIASFYDKLIALWSTKGWNFNEYLENSKLGPIKIAKLPEESARKRIWLSIAKHLDLIKDVDLIKDNNIKPIKPEWVIKYSSFPVTLPNGDRISKLSEILLDDSTDVEKTVNSLNINVDVSKLISNFKLTPDKYIEAMNEFIHRYYSIYRKGESPLDVNHPAWKLWLTILFFSTDKKESWKNIWLTLGYNTIIDDDPRTQITPGLEQMMIANIGKGIERQLIRLDNEHCEVLVLDPTVLKNIRRITLSELQSQESE